MVPGRALSELGAVAWVNTLLVPACFGVRALWVSQAFILAAYLIGVAPVAWQTVTFGFVVSHRALGILPASFVNARVLALPVDAGKVEWTLVVTFAAG